MSAPRIYQQTVRRCGVCPSLGPAIDATRHICSADRGRIDCRGVRLYRSILDLDQIPDWCPLPKAKEEDHRWENLAAAITGGTP